MLACSGVAWSVEISFQRDVLPVLSNGCYACHGPDAGHRKAGLRLDVRDEALKPAKSGDCAIVPGHADRSTLVARIESTQDDELMPPASSHKELTAAQKAVLRQWIAEGARYELHWAFAPLARPEPPATKDAAWPRNAVDRFILARMEAAQLAPSAPAAQAVLVRRIHFDLTGLPPDAQTAAKAGAMTDDAALRAWTSGLLASAAYGEHWARHWMDVVRYGDSAGYELDYLFSDSWRFRDWVVRALQRNMPMDRFIEAQIAGDQLWPGDAGEVDGARFLTIGPRRFEGGIKRTLEVENERLTDLADSTGAAFLGLTMGCARCHDHKYDPISQDDYYGMEAIFADSTVKESRAGGGGGNNDTRPASLSIERVEPPAPVQVLRRGNVESPIHLAMPRLPAAFAAGTPQLAPAPAAQRTQLAHWLTSPSNPLVARVLVNRVWQWHFGTGLVRTPNDFGLQGEVPVHRDLIDWLACELISSGWDLAHLHGLILHSATYRQSSLRSADARERDPDNRLLCGFPRRRLQAEEVRDAMLAVSGLLNPKSGGPPVVPPVEKWVTDSNKNPNWNPTADTAEHQRRSLYLIVRRSLKLPLLEAFNLPDNAGSCAARQLSTVPSQALALLNSSEALRAAQALGERLRHDAQNQPEHAAATAWPLVFARAATDAEQRDAAAFLQSGPDLWVSWCLALLNSNEFMYVD